MAQLYFTDNLPIFSDQNLFDRKDSKEGSANGTSNDPQRHSFSESLEKSVGKTPTSSNQSTTAELPQEVNPSTQSILSLSEPIRAGFYYPWYPEQWSSAGHRYNSTLGNYDSSNSTVIDTHIEQMKFGQIKAGIYSWWGKGSKTDSRFATYIDKASAKNFYWAIYYELDHNATRSQTEISSDMSYLQEKYFRRAGYLHINDKPVVFVYMPTGGSCNQVNKWFQIRNDYNLYINMMDVPEWWTCNKMDSWHTYKPDSYNKAVYVGNTVYSVAASAGFWAAWESSPRLERDFSKWQNAVKVMVQLNPRWELVYFNEFGEGTNIEPSNASCEASNCWDYLNELNQNP